MVSRAGAPLCPGLSAIMKLKWTSFDPTDDPDSVRETAWPGDARLAGGGRGARVSRRRGRCSLALRTGLSALVFSLALLAASSGWSGKAMAQDWKSSVISEMDRGSAPFDALSRQIWKLAELSFEEHRSASLLADVLRKAGFSVQTHLGDMPTAFVATAGSGGPVVAFLGEYDALPGLQQEAVARKQPTGMLGAGHGCGHNLLGTAAAWAAIQTWSSLQKEGRPGTVKFFGCPAEENGCGKVHLLRAGAFAGVDVALTWHPDDRNEPGMRSTLANVGAAVRYRGVSAHAAKAPEKGRSSLDAIQLMSHAVELLREHVPSETRMHYYISHGGTAPNVVPDFAELKITVRHPESTVLQSVWKRVLKCAEAGALATETKLEIEILGALSNVIPNDTLAKLAEVNMQTVGGVRYDAEELRFAEALRELLPPEGKPGLDLAGKVFPIQDGVTPWSTDVGDVSWNVPTGEIRAAAFAPGVTPHTWQSTACSGMSIGEKGMRVAAKTMALTALDVFREPGLVQNAKRDLQRRLNGRAYVSMIPTDAKPRLPAPRP
ncbi:MAG: amidohydrolase [Verrucomicrobia bacterium]|nr:amidohydrolase [Verrucomicrobiota bacterium]